MACQNHLFAKYSLNIPSFNTYSSIYERKHARVCSCRTFWSISHLALSGIPSRLHYTTLEISCILGSNPHRYVDAWSTQQLSSLGTLLVWVGYVVAAGKPVPEIDNLLLLVVYNFRMLVTHSCTFLLVKSTASSLLCCMRKRNSLSLQTVIE